VKSNFVKTSYMFNIAVTETDSALVTRVVVMISMCLKA
jgi:hypothetical protein